VRGLLWYVYSVTRGLDYVCHPLTSPNDNDQVNANLKRAVIVSGKKLSRFCRFVVRAAQL